MHGLITFRAGDKIDELAWQLINTPEFQRLRRIRQLGVSEFVYPGATHTRFAHCIGVFHVARQLLTIIKREISEEKFDSARAEVAVIAALLHDLGHGPFSHTFEGVRKELGAKKRHEEWTADIIRNPQGRIGPLLRSFRTGFLDEVATLLEAEDPSDIYHAVVSSSFDADRLDYLRRDRLMTGTGAGAIDFDWLLEHVRVGKVNLAPDNSDDEKTPPAAPTFCIDLKALPAAENFLLARYSLHEQVYFHKTTRCVERMIAVLLKEVAQHCTGDDIETNTGLSKSHPLVRFFGKKGDTVSNFLALDDIVVMSALERMTKAKKKSISEMARRLRERRLFKTLDLREFGSDAGAQIKHGRDIDRSFKDALGKTVLKDEGAVLSIYSQIGGDDDRAHKRLQILDGDKKEKEISSLSKIIDALSGKRQLVRYYFASETDRDAARNTSKSGKAHA